MIAATAICLALVALLAWERLDRGRERREHQAERAMLMQRIQAPEAAVAQHAAQVFTDAPQFIPLDDDAAWSERMSKEQLAEAVDRAGR